MATALHPHYTMCLVSHFNPNEATVIKKRIADEMIEMVGAEVRQPVEKEEEVDQFHILLDTAEVTEVRQREEVEEIVKKILKEWKMVVVSVPSATTYFPPNTGMLGWTSLKNIIPLFQAQLLWKDYLAQREIY